MGDPKYHFEKLRFVRCNSPDGISSKSTFLGALVEFQFLCSVRCIPLVGIPALWSCPSNANLTYTYHGAGRDETPATFWTVVTNGPHTWGMRNSGPGRELLAERQGAMERRRAARGEGGGGWRGASAPVYTRGPPAVGGIARGPGRAGSGGQPHIRPPSHSQESVLGDHQHRDMSLLWGSAVTGHDLSGGLPGVGYGM